MTEVEQEQKLYRFTALGPDANLLIPPAAQCVADAVRDSSAACSEALDVYWQASREMNAARAARETAAHVDRSADTAAVAAGTPLPTKRAEHEAQRAFDLAQRKHNAASAALEDAQRSLASEILDAKPTWIPAQEAEIEAQRADIRELLADLSDRWDTLEVEHRVLEALRRIDQGSLSGVSFGVRAPKFQRQHDEQRATAFADVATQARLHPSSSSIPRNFNDLIGGLLTLVPQIGGER